MKDLRIEHSFIPELTTNPLASHRTLARRASEGRASEGRASEGRARQIQCAALTSTELSLPPSLARRAKVLHWHTTDDQRGPVFAGLARASGSPQTRWRAIAP